MLTFSYNYKTLYYNKIIFHTYSGTVAINKRNISSVIWKDLFLENILKNIKRNANYKRLFGPPAEAVMMNNQ